jgi:hypothetical protein
VTRTVHEALLAARARGAASHECSLDLGRSMQAVGVDDAGWSVAGVRFPYLDACRDRTVYRWTERGFEPVARYTTALVKLVPTEWGPPTFEVDGIKMLPTLRVSPYEDARRKVALVEPRGKVIFDTCGGLGYFAGWCIRGGARRVLSCEKNPDVLWLRTQNPWSPESSWSDEPTTGLELEACDVLDRVATLPGGSVDAVLHDPPRFGIAGELYSGAFYGELARVLRRGGLLFHYTGAPNRLTSGRDVPREVAARLQAAGFRVRISGDGVLASNSGHSGPR